MFIGVHPCPFLFLCVLGAFAVNLGLWPKAALGSSRFRLYVDDAAAAEDLAIANTGGWQSWRTLALSKVTLSAGKHILKLFAVKGGFNLNTINFRTSV